MHHCLRIYEVVVLIFEFVGCQFCSGSRQGKKTFFSLARTCHFFSSPALDILWRDLYSFRPLLHVSPVVLSDVEDTQWLTFRKYASRVKTIQCSNEQISAQAKQIFISSLQRCPKSYLPLLPNVTKLEWRESSLAPREDPSISLLKYFAGPSITTISLSFVRWLAHASEVAVMADLPSLCPSVTSFTIDIHLSWHHEPAQEVGMMVNQWPRLQTLRTPALAQSVMDQLFSGRILETLSIDYHETSPVYVGSIPHTVRGFSLSANRPRLCTRFLESVHASPLGFCLLIGMNEGKEENDAEELIHLLPRRLDRSRLQSLKIQPGSTIVGMPLWNTLELRASHLSALVEFTALQELDLDLHCTAQISDADYIRMAASLTQLRSLKLGTANPSIMRPCPAASVAALIAVLMHCKHLEAFHILFNGSIPPPGCSSLKNCEVIASTALACQGWEASNRRITKLCVGYSPIVDTTIGIISSYLKLMMPCLIEIEHKRNGNWKVVQDMLDIW